MQLPPPATSLPSTVARPSCDGVCLACIAYCTRRQLLVGRFDISRTISRFRFLEMLPLLLELLRQIVEAPIGVVDEHVILLLAHVTVCLRAAALRAYHDTRNDHNIRKQKQTLEQIVASPYLDRVLR